MIYLASLEHIFGFEAHSFEFSEATRTCHMDVTGNLFLGSIRFHSNLFLDYLPLEVRIIPYIFIHFQYKNQKNTCRVQLINNNIKLHAIK